MCTITCCQVQVHPCASRLVGCLPVPAFQGRCLLPHALPVKAFRFINISPSQLEKEMATHSSVLAWRIPGTGEPGGLPSPGSHRVGQD